MSGHKMASLKMGGERATVLGYTWEDSTGLGLFFKKCKILLVETRKGWLNY